MVKIAITVTDLDGDSNLVPVTTLSSTDFKFIKAVDNVTEVTFSGFANNGNGNYLFWGFDVDPYLPPDETSQPQGIQVRVKINDVFQDGYGTFSVYADNDEPPSFSYSLSRVDREGDTVFYWLTYVPDAGHTPAFNPYDPDTAAEPDNVLVCNKYVKDNFAGLGANNYWFNGPNLYDVAPMIDGAAAEYLAGNPADEKSFVWKKWVEDNFGDAGAAWSVEGRALLVDKNITTNVVGKKYNNLATACAYAASQSPTTINRWKIYIIPYMVGGSSGYTDNITIVPGIDLIGVGQVKLSCSVTLSGTFTGQPKSFWKNIDFERINVNQTFEGISFDCCNLYMWNLSSTHTLTLTTCQLKNTGLFRFNTGGTGVLASGAGNRVIGCYGNQDISWDPTDKIYGYSHIDDATEYWFNGTSM